ncbi:MAG: M56 family metallopeptidase, partial [Proteobacteria bacterium]|nr:M56 family metallopeptidase [Pseudomonadota bacterium]
SSVTGRRTMHELAVVLKFVSFAYAAAAAGLVAALIGRAWTRRGGRLPAVGEATWCAFLPLVAVLLMPLSTLYPHPNATPVAIHDRWHAFAQAIHAAPAAHGTLHAANALLLFVAMVSVGRAVYTLARIRAFVTAIRVAASRSVGAYDSIPVFSIASPQLVCFTMGVLRPAVYLSASLQQHLTPRDRQAMLAHEAAHIRRRDNAVRMLLFLFYALFPLPASRLLLADWQRAAEMDCDAEAASRIGSAPDVAAALIRAAQLTVQRSAAMPTGTCFVAFDDDIEGRVGALLADPLRRSQHRPTRLVLFGISFLLAAGVWIYHLVDLFVHH